MNKKQYLVKTDLVKKIISDLNIPDSWIIKDGMGSLIFIIQHLTGSRLIVKYVINVETYDYENFSIIFEEHPGATTHLSRRDYKHGPFEIPQLIKKINELIAEINMNEVLDR